MIPGSGSSPARGPPALEVEAIGTGRRVRGCCERFGRLWQRLQVDLVLSRLDFGRETLILQARFLGEHGTPELASMNTV